MTADAIITALCNLLDVDADELIEVVNHMRVEAADLEQRVNTIVLMHVWDDINGRATCTECGQQAPCHTLTAAA